MSIDYLIKQVIHLIQLIYEVALIYFMKQLPAADSETLSRNFISCSFSCRIALYKFELCIIECYVFVTAC